MGKQKPLSAENYIRAKARTLPIDACYVNVDWETARMANVVVIRRHVTGNITCAFYMVDLLCRGIKDSFYYFNLPHHEIEENFDFENPGQWQKISYELAHNIVYAGHDFAMDFHIEPHKGFAVTRYVLEEDNDNVPLIEIETGDRENKPHLMVNVSEAYGDVLAKLKKYAGEGNYTFTTIDENMDWEDEENEDEDDESEMAEEMDHESVDGVEPGFLDFHHVSEISSPELVQMLLNNTRTPIEDFIIKSELLFRVYDQEKDGIVITDDDAIIGTPAYGMFEAGDKKANEAYERSKPFLNELGAIARDLGLLDINDRNAVNNYLGLVERYKENEFVVWLVLQATPTVVIIEMYDGLLQGWDRYPILVQLIITAIGLILEKEDIDQYRHLLSAEDVEGAYVSNKDIHSLHHKFFWLVKALYALNSEDEKSLWHWHNLIRMTGIGGTMKTLYAVKLNSWLSAKLNFDDDRSLEGILEYADKLS